MKMSMYILDDPTLNILWIELRKNMEMKVHLKCDK